MTAQNAHEEISAEIIDLSSRTARNRAKLHALLRAELGWTRNEQTHELLSSMPELAELGGVEIRIAPAGERTKRVFAGSRWTLSEAGLVELGRLRQQHPDVTTNERPTWSPSAVSASERIGSGVYRVQLENKAKATIARADAIKDGKHKGPWYWADRFGGVEGINTKGEAIESFRRIRG